MNKWVKYGSAGVVVLFLGIQLIPVNRSNPRVTQDLTAPATVQQVLKRACYDCHSNETRWPWYALVAPISWRITSHVNEGRAHLNFSEWDTIPLKKKLKRLDDIPEEIEEGKMPLKDYLLMHRTARLSEAEKALLKQWVKESLNRLKGEE